MIIRKSSITDESEILRLLDELGHAVNSSDNAETRDQSASILEEIVNRNDTFIFVAEDNGHLLGLATFYLLPNIRHGWHRGHIEDFVVSKEARGKGVGSKIFDFIKQYCKTHNIKVVKLDCSIENKEAQTFYEKCGGKNTEIMFRFDIP